MTMTRDQLVLRALKKLKVIGAGQTPSAAVTDSVNDVVPALMADLASRGIFAWGDQDELPDEAFEHLADVLANACAGDFGKEASEDRRILAESRLRLVNPIRLSGQPLKATYY